MSVKSPAGARYEKKRARVFTTGEVAKYCGVHFRTVIRWIERGKLKAYKLPGRGDNRIEENDFLAFLETNGMPIPDDLQQHFKRILIVDDEKEMASVIQRIFKREGYETAIAHDGFQAGEMLSTFQPNLMTLDLSMPHMDGFAVLEYISNHSHYKKLKVVVVSALDDTVLEQTKSAGAHRALSKPFKKDDLLEVVKELIGGTGI